MLLQRQRMRQLLAGMGDGLHVDHRHGRIRGEGLQHDVLAVVGPVDELRERAYADQVHVTAQHLRDFGDVLLGVAIHHRAEVELDGPCVLARLQHHGMAAQLERPQLEAGAGAHGRIEEHQRDRLALQRVTQLVLLVEGGLGQQRIEVAAAPVLRVQEVLHYGILVSGMWQNGLQKRKNPASGWVPVNRRKRPGYPARCRIPVDAHARSCPRPGGPRCRHGRVRSSSWARMLACAAAQRKDGFGCVRNRACNQGPLAVAWAGAT